MARYIEGKLRINISQYVYNLHLFSSLSHVVTLCGTFNLRQNLFLHIFAVIYVLIVGYMRLTLAAEGNAPVIARKPFKIFNFSKKLVTYLCSIIWETLTLSKRRHLHFHNNSNKVRNNVYLLIHPSIPSFLYS